MSLKTKMTTIFRKSIFNTLVLRHKLVSFFFGNSVRKYLHYDYVIMFYYRTYWFWWNKDSHYGQYGFSFTEI